MRWIFSGSEGERDLKNFPEIFLSMLRINLIKKFPRAYLIKYIKKFFQALQYIIFKF